MSLLGGQIGETHPLFLTNLTDIILTVMLTNDLCSIVGHGVLYTDQDFQSYLEESSRLCSCDHSAHHEE